MTSTLVPRFLLLLATLSSIARADARATNLDPAQSRALLNAAGQTREVAWRLFTTTIEGRPRSVLMLGEVHVAFPEDLDAARTVIDEFEYISTENGPFSQDPSWRYRHLRLGAALLRPEGLIMVTLGHRESTSPMELARRGRRVKYVSNAEQLHQPHWTEEVDFLTMGILSASRVTSAAVALFSLWRLAYGVTPGRVRRLMASGGGVVATTVAEALIFRDVRYIPLVRNRDQSMVKYVERWVREDKSEAPMLMIVGRAHLKNIGDLLTKQFGFTEVPIDAEHLAAAEQLIAN